LAIECASRNTRDTDLGRWDREVLGCVARLVKQKSSGYCRFTDPRSTQHASQHHTHCFNSPAALPRHGRRAHGPSAELQAMRRLSAVILLATLLGAGVAGYFWHAKHRFVPGQVPLRAIPADQLAAHVQAIAGVDAGELAELLVPDAKITEFAERAARGKSTAWERGQAIVAALQQRKQKLAFVEWTRVEPRDGPPLVASKTLSTLASDGARRELYPLELAALAVASLRSLDVPALVAEVYRYPDERGALDASGRLGYYAVVIPGDAPQSARLLDAYGGRSSAPAAADYSVLNDAQVVGAALSIRAMHRLKNAFDPDAARADAAAALKLLPRSPSAHSVRAEVWFAAADGAPDGTRELEAALQLRADAARHNNLAVHALSEGNREGTVTHLKAALSEAPDYALALVVQGAWFLMLDDITSAFASLERAKKLEPNLALLPQVEAQLHAKIGDIDLALKSAAESVKRRPADPQPLFILARIERSAGHDADMRKHAREILDYVPVADRERRKSMLRSILGQSVFDAVPDAGAADAQAR
jgi:Tfp pilus assembly protein PilF